MKRHSLEITQNTTDIQLAVVWSSVVFNRAPWLPENPQIMVTGPRGFVAFCKASICWSCHDVETHVTDVMRKFRAHMDRERILDRVVERERQEMSHK